MLSAVPVTSWAKIDCGTLEDFEFATFARLISFARTVSDSE